MGRDRFRILREAARLDFIEGKINLRGAPILTLYGRLVPEECRARYVLDLEMDPDLPAQHILDLEEDKRITAWDLFCRIFPEEARKTKRWKQRHTGTSCGVK